MISLSGFGQEPADLRAAMLQAMTSVVDSHHYILGHEVDNFEAAWAAACGTQYAVGVGNGMDALELALRASGVGPGDEVVTTAMSAAATVLAIIRAGATPVFADIDSETGLLSRESVLRCIGPRTKGILPVHLYGQLRDMKEWLALSSEHGLVLVEDCAQAHLAKEGDRVAGSFGSASAFSFYPTKNLGAVGDAGAVVTNNPEIAESVRRARNYGQSRQYAHDDFGVNSRLDELQAALLSVRLRWLTAFTRRRRELASLYREVLKGTNVGLMSLPPDPEGHVFHQFVITTEFRDELRSFLHSRQIPTLIHYPTPLHHQPPFRSFKADPRGLHWAEKHAATCLSLPCHPQLSDSDVITVAEAVAEFSK